MTRNSITSILILATFSTYSYQFFIGVGLGVDLVDDGIENTDAKAGDPLPGEREFQDLALGPRFVQLQPDPLHGLDQVVFDEELQSGSNFEWLSFIAFGPLGQGLSQG